MTTYQPGDLVLVAFPLVGGGPARVRPALVLLDTGDADVLLARVTSQAHATPFDVAIADWQGAGLLGPSTVRLHKLATIEKTLIQRQVGSLQPADRASVAAVLNQAFANW